MRVVRLLASCGILLVQRKKDVSEGFSRRVLIQSEERSSGKMVRKSQNLFSRPVDF